MLVRLVVRHPKVNFRAHCTLDLAIDKLPDQHEVLNLSSLVKDGLPSVKRSTIITYLDNRPPEINAIIMNPSKFSGSKCEDLFLYEDGWQTYGSFS